MKYNIQELYKKFEEVKSAKEYADYRKDIEDNWEIVTQIPFDKNRAKAQLSILTTKYEDELNWLAMVYSNGMTVVKTAQEKSDAQLKDNLLYINNQIPIIAFKRELTSYAFDKLLGIK